MNRRTFLVIYIAYIHLTGYLLAPKRKHLKLTEAQALIKGIRGIKLLAGAFLDGLDLQVFSEKKAMALLYKLEKCTIDLVKLSREIVELSREMQTKWKQSKSD